MRPPRFRLWMLMVAVTLVALGCFAGVLVRHRSDCLDRARGLAQEQVLLGQQERVLLAQELAQLALLRKNAELEPSLAKSDLDDARFEAQILAETRGHVGFEKRMVRENMAILLGVDPMAQETLIPPGDEVMRQKAHAFQLAVQEYRLAFKRAKDAAKQAEENIATVERRSEENMVTIRRRQEAVARERFRYERAARYFWLPVPPDWLPSQ